MTRNPTVTDYPLNPVYLRTAEVAGRLRDGDEQLNRTLDDRAQSTPRPRRTRRVDIPPCLALFVVITCAAGCRSGQRTHTADSVSVHGYVAPGFEEVRHAFAENFALRGELGAACSLYYQGECVVDLWGGIKNQKTGQPWREDTLVMVYSATKGVCGLALALAHSRGWLDYDAPVARYWPEFAANGKAEITVRQLLAHQAGMAVVDERLDAAALADLDRMAAILARQRPAWPPGSKSGYHALSLGWYENELIRRVDPQHRSMGRFVREELAEPLGVEFYIGLPEGFDSSRVADIVAFDLWDVLRDLDGVPPSFAWAMLWPTTLTRRAMSNPRVWSLGDFDTPPYRAVEFPAANGIGTARALAAMYGAFANGGAVRTYRRPETDRSPTSSHAADNRTTGQVRLDLRPQTLAELARPARVPPAGARDAVLKVDTLFSLGFMKPTATFNFADHQAAYGSPGAGGSLAYADPKRRLGFAYVLNRTGVGMGIDDRAAAVRDACLRAIERLGSPPARAGRVAHRFQYVRACSKSRASRSSNRSGMMRISSATMPTQIATGTDRQARPSSASDISRSAIAAGQPQR